MIHLDFETRSEANINRVGSWAYAEHPSTEVMCASWAIDDGPIRLWHRAHPGIRGSDPPEELLDEIFLGETLEAHNANFERAIMLVTWPREFSWARPASRDVVDPGRWRCSAAAAASFALPRALGGAAEALRLDVEKDRAGQQLMWIMSKPRPENQGGGWNEDPDDLLRLWEYCRNDVRTEREISRAIRPLSDAEQALWEADCRMNERGVTFDAEYARSALRLIEEEKRVLNSEVERLTDGVVERATQRARVISWTEGRGVSLPDTKARTIKDMLAPMQKETDSHFLESLRHATGDRQVEAHLPPDVARVLEIMTVVNKTSVKKFSVALEGESSGARLRNTQMFHGANTGRWSGKGIQPHNFPRGLGPGGCEAMRQDAVSMDYEDFILLHGDVANILSKALRGIIVSPPGRELFVADYSSIEARIVFWIAGEQGALDLYAGGADLYVDMACSIYKCRPEDVDFPRRWMGKQGILGLGYNMGAMKFKQRCIEEGYIDVPIEFCKEVVSIYRQEKYPLVAEFWGKLERAAMSAVKTGGPAKAGDRLTFFMSGRFLHARLPSGRLLSYAEPTVVPLRWWMFPCLTKEGEEMFVATQTKPTAPAPTEHARKLAKDNGWELLKVPPRTRDGMTLTYMTSRGAGTWRREDTYGGKLTENVTQAIARDVLAAAIVRLDRSRDFSDVVMTVHDEVVCECDPSADLREFEALVAEPPPWADGLPVAVEAWQGPRYGKA